MVNSRHRNQLDPLLLISFFPQLEAHEKKLQSSHSPTEEEEQILDGLGTLLDWLRYNYRSTLAKIASLIAHGEITFDLLYAILVPRSLLVTRDHATGEPRCVRLISAQRDGEVYSISCETVEMASPAKGSIEQNALGEVLDDSDAQRSRFAAGGRAFGKYIDIIYMRIFGGTQKINKLSVYPLVYHTDPDALRETLIKRGRKWASLNGVHHVYYRGLAGIQGRDSYVRYNVSTGVFFPHVN